MAVIARPTLRAAFGLGALLLLAAAQARPEDLFQGFDVQPGLPPAVSGGAGEHRLVYELHLTNFAAAPLTIVAIETLDGASGRLLARLDEAALRSAVEQPGGEGDPRIVPPGRRAVVYLEVAPGAATPVTLRHRILVRSTTGQGERAIGAGALAVDMRPLPVLWPPLRGGPWVAVYDPGMERGHRRVVYAVQGRARIPGRHAIDWMPAPERGSDGAGAEVLAVSDGIVAAVRDRFPDPRPGEPPQDRTLDDAAGNYVALRIAPDRYAVYEHLAAGIAVRPGERVRKGQVIARLGATGQVSQPHLHFHLGDSPEPLLAEGLPYLIEHYRLLGQFESIEAFGTNGTRRPMAARDVEQGFPAPNAIVELP